jgi:tetratricopeptide (TPR) repeat protein
MPDELIQTGVDGLIRLVEEKNRISVSDAAKELGVPVKTIEKWMDFLVEEEKIGVEYKFTTPYLYRLDNKPKDVKDIKISKKELLDIGNVDITTSDNLDDDLDLDFSTESDDSPDSDDDSKNEIVDEEELQGDRSHFDKLNKFLHPKTETKKIVSPVDKAKVAFEKIIDKVNSDKLTESYELYSKAKHFVSKLPDTEEMDYFNKKMIEINELFLDRVKKLLPEMEKMSNEIGSQIKEGIKKIEIGNIEEGKAYYSQIVKLYNSMPDILAEKKKLLYNEIFDYYKFLVNKEYSLNIIKINQIEEKIVNYISNVEYFLEENDFKKANLEFEKINSSFDDLPVGFTEYKLDIHTKILKLYEELKISNKVRQLYLELTKMNSKVARVFEPRPISSITNMYNQSNVAVMSNSSMNQSNQLNNKLSLTSSLTNSNDSSDVLSNKSMGGSSDFNNDVFSNIKLDSQSRAENYEKLKDLNNKMSGVPGLDDIAKESINNGHGFDDVSNQSKMADAISLLSVGDFDSAKKTLNEILSINPNNLEAKKLMESINDFD